MTDLYPVVAPSQVTLIIGDIVLDDCTAIAWMHSQPKLPVYGWNDTKVRSWAQGRSIVRGRLRLVKRVTNYLYYVLRGAGESGIEADRTDPTVDQFYSRHRDLVERLQAPDSADGDVDELMTELAALGRESREALQNAVDAAKLVPSARPVRHQQYRPPEKVLRNTSIVVAYGEDYQVDMLQPRVEVITGVQFEGSSTEIVADVPLGGQPIQEEYSFVARDVTPRYT